MALNEWSTSPTINRDPYGGNDWLPAGTTPYIPPASTQSTPALPSGSSSPSASGPADSFLGGLTSGFGALTSGLTKASSVIPSANVSTSVASKSGDAQSPFDLSFQYGGAFQVGGSGSQTQSAQQQAGSANNIAMYVAIGVAALIALASIFNARGSK